MVKIISMRVSHSKGTSNLGVHDYAKIWLKNGFYLSGRILNLAVDGGAIDYVVVNNTDKNGRKKRYLVAGNDIETIDTMQLGER